MNEIINKNTGIIIVPPTETDYVAGGESGIEYKINNPLGYWNNLLPQSESQIKDGGAGKVLDTQACVTFSALNSLEVQYKFLTGKEINFAERFIAKMSGTTVNGNTLQKVAQTIREVGLVEEQDWPWDINKDFTWEKYYAEIPQSVKDKAKKFLDDWEVRYEWVVTGTPNNQALKDHLKQAPLQIALKVCDGWGSKTPVPSCTGPVGHAVLLTSPDNHIFDHYNPFNKQLAKDYVIPWAMKLVLIPKGNNMLGNTKAEFVHKSGTSEYGIQVYFPATSPEALEDKAKNFGLSLPKNADGSINFSQAKEI